MDFLQFLAIQQTIVWAVFSIVAVAGAFAMRRWGWRASVVAVILAWPVFVSTALLNELRLFPQLLELNSFGIVFRNLWVPPTLATVAFAVSLWLVRRATTNRRLVLQSIGVGAVWAFVMPVPLTLIAIGLSAVIPAGTAEYHYVDFRPMGLEVLETGTPSFRHYTGGEIPLRYRAELDGRELEVEIRPEQGMTAQLWIRATAPDSPRFEVDAPGLGRCGFKHVRPRDNVISADWSTLPELRGTCYGEGAQDAELTFRFVGSETSLTLRGPVVKGGEYYFYNTF
jgi:hypothetical protein